jgi:hypothetical protein
MPLFLKFIIFLHSFIQYNHTPFILHHSLRPVFLTPHRVFAQQGEPPWDAETRFELGPALQQADALPTGLRRILTGLRRILTGLRRIKLIKSANIPRIFEKFETALMGFSGAWGNLFTQKI